jgi:uncharacterized protein YciW
MLSLEVAYKYFAQLTESPKTADEVPRFDKRKLHTLSLEAAYKYFAQLTESPKTAVR